jgi:hypothetical protein
MHHGSSQDLVPVAPKAEEKAVERVRLLDLGKMQLRHTSA